MIPPLVSIGFPVYNGAEALGRALDSILGQDFGDFELIVADNASTDDTGLVCADYAKKDPRIRYVRNESNIGVNPNHNLVFNLSRGRYFAWAAHDIEQLPGMLGRCVSEMQTGPRAPVLVYPLCELAGDTGMPPGWTQPSIASADSRPSRRAGTVIRNISFVTQHYGLFDAEALRKTRMNGSYASSDLVLTAEMAMLGEIREIPEVLLRRTIHRDRGTAAVIKNHKAWSAWSGSKRQSGSFLPVRERLAFEYVRAIWNLPLRLPDKLACLITVPVAHYRKELWEHSGPRGRQFVEVLGKVRRRLGR